MLKIHMPRPIRRVLIANRGEIAVRVNRSCRDLGLETVQVYSEADRDSVAVKLADRAVCIGRPRSFASYLNQAVLVKAAKAFKADAVHPGYGFLAENPEFAALCADEGLTWIGPNADVIRLMGNKVAARQAAADTGLKMTPGSKGIVRDWGEADEVAEAIGFPLVLKPSAGGGGRGMRMVTTGAGLKDAFGQAQREAQAAFGDGSLYVEKFLTRVRHIEVQVLGDEATMLHLGERDCSTQRRNQKLAEESPGAGLTDRLRRGMCEGAVRLAKSVGYTSAGTIEFIVDDAAQEFYFMEMNTRIQVEHPVTEMVTGIDLVKSQLRIASGEGLGLKQQDIVRGMSARKGSRSWAAQTMTAINCLRLHFRIAQAYVNCGSRTMPKLEKINVYRLRVPLRVPYKLVFGPVEYFDTIIAEVIDRDGRSGFGEATILTGYTDETIEDSWRVAQEFAAAIAASADDARPRIGELGVKFPFTATAFGTALEMLEGSALLRLPAAAAVPLVGLLNAKDEAAMHTEFAQLQQAGYRTIKVKVGFDLVRDIVLVRTFQKVVGGRALIRLDANQAFTAEQGIAFVRALDPAGIELFDSPARPATGMRTWRWRARRGCR